MGLSLGGGPAVWSATNCNGSNKFAGLILKNTYTELADVIGWRFCLSWLFRKILRDWRNIDLIKEVNIPVFILTGLKDMVVPPRHSQALFDNVPYGVYKKKQNFPTCGHQDLWKAYPELFNESFN
mmetsp:Transcript_22487/g.31654  ORF Transcript_22487/g.31654 Transcript_22487/m.31654 type:complete len:125 (-) Transcript_22487:142-516(-)